MDRNNNFSLVHILAALMVIVGHEFVLLGLNPPLVMGKDIHGLGVRILFLVSGYLVCSSYLRSDNVLKYICKRISRLYPALIFCLILTVLFMRLITTEPAHYWISAWTYFVHNVEMRPKFDLVGVFNDNIYPIGVNGSLWTLPIEVMCYFLLVPVIEIYRMVKNILTRVGRENLGLSHHQVGTLLFFLILLTISFVDTLVKIYLADFSLVFWDTDWMNFISLSTWFFTGAFCCLTKLEDHINWQVGVVLGIIYMCLPHQVCYFLAPFVVGYIVLGFALAEKPKFAKSVRRDICYGLYLYAFPVQQVVIWVVLKNSISIKPYLLLIISIFITYILAEMSYWIVEKKLGEYITKMIKEFKRFTLHT